ncbi:sugar O-acetyltransferase [Pseudomonas sp. QL9]|uniref:sugar O-acetyltransferase n=1 Tax=Pseudomonas sp. QL9 TaxID=3242725 RepID=UPI00352B42B2
MPISPFRAQAAYQAASIMFFRLLISLKKRITARDFCRVFNASDLGKKKYNRLLQKTGVISPGNTVIRPPFYFEYGNISFGDRVFVNTGCIFLDNAPITIGARTLIGPGVKFCTTTHHVSPSIRHERNLDAPISIGSNCWIGAGTVVLPGVIIGDNSVVAANSVVTRDIEPNALYAGAPATRKRSLDIDVQKSVPIPAPV